MSLMKYTSFWSGQQKKLCTHSIKNLKLLLFHTKHVAGFKPVYCMKCGWGSNPHHFQEGRIQGTSQHFMVFSFFVIAATCKTLLSARPCQHGSWFSSQPGYIIILYTWESCSDWNFLSATTLCPQNLNPPCPTPTGVWEILPAPSLHTIPTYPCPALFLSQTHTRLKSIKNSKSLKTSLTSSKIKLPILFIGNQTIWSSAVNRFVIKTTFQSSCDQTVH